MAISGQVTGSPGVKLQWTHGVNLKWTPGVKLQWTPGADGGNIG